MRPIVSIPAPFGVKIQFTTLSLLLFVVFIPLMGWLGTLWLTLTTLEFVVTGFAITALMYLSETFHQLGHAWAAWRVGYPMRAVCFFSPLAISLYPKDEPELPRHMHAKRALGGFWVNMLIGLLLLPLAVNLWPRADGLAWAVMFMAVYNLIILGLGALTPLSIPSLGVSLDGGTLLYLWREARAEKASLTGQHKT